MLWAYMADSYVRQLSRSTKLETQMSYVRKERRMICPICKKRIKRANKRKIKGIWYHKSPCTMNVFDKHRRDYGTKRNSNRVDKQVA